MPLKVESTAYRLECVNASLEVLVQRLQKRHMTEGRLHPDSAQVADGGEAARCRIRCASERVVPLHICRRLKWQHQLLQDSTWR